MCEGSGDDWGPDWRSAECAVSTEKVQKRIDELVSQVVGSPGWLEKQKKKANVIKPEGGNNVIEHLPMIPHLPWSFGRGIDNLVHKSLAMFEGREVVVTLKMDGIPTAMSQSHLYTPTKYVNTYPTHPTSASILTKYQAIRQKLPAGYSFYGENVLAQRTVPYPYAPNSFLVHTVMDETGCILDYVASVMLCFEVGLEVVPSFYHGKFKADALRQASGIMNSLKIAGGLQEGFVVRNADAFNIRQYTVNTGKWVRSGFIDTNIFAHDTVIFNGMLKAKKDVNGWWM